MLTTNSDAISNGFAERSKLPSILYWG